MKQDQQKAEILKAQINYEKLTPLQWDGIMRAMDNYAEQRLFELRNPEPSEQMAAQLYPLDKGEIWTETMNKRKAWINSHKAKDEPSEDSGQMEAKNKPHCWGKMTWILQYEDGKEPKTSICDCEHNAMRCKELTRANIGQQDEDLVQAIFAMLRVYSETVNLMSKFEDSNVLKAKTFMPVSRKIAALLPSSRSQEKEIEKLKAEKAELIDALKRSTDVNERVSVYLKELSKPTYGTTPCIYEQDDTTAMNCRKCGRSKWMHTSGVIK